jgi:hypothetical protein
MEPTKKEIVIETKSSFLQKHRINFILIGLILFMGTLIIANLNGKFLQGNLISGETVVQDIKLQSGTVSSKTVGLQWNDPAGTTSTGSDFYTGEVRYEVKFYTGEVPTAELTKRWDAFADVNYSNITQDGKGGMSTTALGLQPHTLYTFGVLKHDTPHNTAHMSNAFSVKTNTLDTQNTQGVGNGGSMTKGDVTGDGDITSWDSYAVTMYIYFHNWAAFTVAMQTQGILLDKHITEQQFKQRADVDGNCSIDFNDVALISQMATGKITVFPPSSATGCSY